MWICIVGFVFLFIFFKFFILLLLVGILLYVGFEFVIFVMIEVLDLLYYLLLKI